MTSMPPRYSCRIAWSMSSDHCLSKLRRSARSAPCGGAPPPAVLKAKPEENLPPRPGPNRPRQCIVRVEAFEILDEPACRFRVDRVANFGTVDGHHDHWAVGFVTNGHGLWPPELLRVHERIAMVGWRRVRLLDHPRARPADEVEDGAGLVVGARCASTA